MRSLIFIGIMTSLLAILLSSCSQKLESEIIKEAKVTAENTFKTDEIIPPNHDLNDLSFYLPNRLKVKKEEASNIILTDGKRTYIIFYNNLEDPMSELNYLSAQNEQALLLESFEDTNKFGYIRIMPAEDDGYEMQVSVGGVKITTYTTKDQIGKDAEELMQVSLSTQLHTEPGHKK